MLLSAIETKIGIVDRLAPLIDDTRNPLLVTHTGLGDWTLEIIKCSDAARGFIILPRRWVVERIFAWLNRNRRMAKDVEASIESAEACLYIASVKLISRRLAVG